MAPARAAGRRRNRSGLRAVRPISTTTPIATRQHHRCQWAKPPYLNRSRRRSHRRCGRRDRTGRQLVRHLDQCWPWCRYWRSCWCTPWRFSPTPFRINIGSIIGAGLGGALAAGWGSLFEATEGFAAASPWVHARTVGLAGIGTGTLGIAGGALGAQLPGVQVMYAPPR